MLSAQLQASPNYGGAANVTVADASAIAQVVLHHRPYYKTIHFLLSFFVSFYYDDEFVEIE